MTENISAKLENISLNIKGNEILKNINLIIQNNNLHIVVGKSGAGKSTILNILAGLLKPSGGNIQKPDNIRVVFQDSLLLKWRNVLQNTRLGLEYGSNKISKQERNAKALEVLKSLNIEHLAYRQVSSLSGGEAKRVSIARSIAANPGLLLLDEPFSALDQYTKTQIWSWLKESIHRLNISALLVTHDLKEAVQLADYISILNSSTKELITIKRSDLSHNTDIASRELYKYFEDDSADSDISINNSDASANLLEQAPKPGIKRRSLIAAGAGALALSAAPVASAFTKPKNNIIASSGDLGQLNIGYLPITDASPLIIAYANGEFQSRGISANAPQLFRGWSTLIEAFQGGSVDIVHLLMPLALQLKYESNFPIKILAWNHINGSALAVATDIGSANDLAGKSIAIPAWYSIHNIIIQKLLKAHGITPVIDQKPSKAAKTTQLIVMQPADMPSALENGSIAGYIVAEPFCAIAEINGYGKILRFSGDIWKDHACCVTVVRQEVVNNNPELALKAAEAIVASQIYISSNRKETAKILSEGGYLPQALGAIEKALEKEFDDGYIDSGAIKHADWNGQRIGFIPYAYPSYTKELVDALRETAVDSDSIWINKLNSGDVHADIVATDININAIDNLGGLSLFNASTIRTEQIDI